MTVCRAGCHLEATVVVGDDAMHDRETEPTPLLSRPDGKERLENVLCHLWQNSFSSIADLKSRDWIGGNYQDPSVFVNRIAEIDGKIEYHLL